MTAAATETRAFEAEVAQVLHLVTHSLYSHKDIFLRELVSNASDACDKLRFAALSDAALTADDAELRIEIAFDRDARTLVIRDNGIGMDRAEVVENIGTIARSGTRRFLESLSGDARKIQPKILLSVGELTSTRPWAVRHAQVLQGVSRAKAVRLTPDR